VLVNQFVAFEFDDGDEMIFVKALESIVPDTPVIVGIWFT
jgi:hypothetical protein